MEAFVPRLLHSFQQISANELMLFRLGIFHYPTYPRVREFEGHSIQKWELDSDRLSVERHDT
jgi:hypothetical protein